MAYRNYGPNAGYVVAKDGTGDFLTIGAGLTAAASLGGSGTLYIKDGTYTENPTGVAGWNLVAWDADALTPNVIINGKFTFTSAGSVSISGIQLQTNSDNFLAVTGSAASVVNLTNCYLNCLNNTGISFSSSSGSALIYILNCTGNIATTGIALYTSSSSGTIHIEYSDIRNTGNSTTASSNSAGEAAISFCVFTFPLSSSSTGGLTLEHTTISCAPINATAATYNGTGPSTSRFNFYGSGTASAITIGTGVTVEITQSIVFSSNTNAITGLGTINYGGIVFDGSSSTINTSVQTPIPWPVKQGGTGSSSFTAYGPVVAASTTTGALTSVSPSSTSGIPFISQGSSANPAFGTCVVAGGGTGVATLTGLALGSGTSAFTGVSYTPATSLTVALTFGGASTGITYFSTQAYYQRVGNFIWLQLQILLTNKGSATGVASITGLPTGPTGGIGNFWPCTFQNVTLTATNLSGFAFINSGSTNIDLYQSTINGTLSQLTNTNFANNSDIYINLAYIG